MQNPNHLSPNNEYHYPIISQQQKPDLLLLKGTLLVVTFLVAMAVIIHFIPGLKLSEVAVEESPESDPQPLIINAPGQQPPNNDLGLTLEEYSNLSDPTDEMLNCLKFEGGKGCFENDYQPTQPKSYYQYSSANNLKAVRVLTGQFLPYWQPSSLPPVQSCLSREFLVRWQGKTYCGRRLIKQY